MRTTPRLVVAALAGLIVPGAAAPTTDLPLIKAGAWEVTGTWDGQSIAERTCDDGTLLQAFASPPAGCTATASRTPNGGWQIETKCDRPEVKSVARVTIEGDLNAAFVLDFEVTGSRGGGAQGTHRVHQTLRYAGACPQGPSQAPPSAAHDPL